MWSYVDSNGDGEVDEQELSAIIGPQEYHPPTPQDIIRMCD